MILLSLIAVAMSAPAKWGPMSAKTTSADGGGGNAPQYRFRQGSPFGRTGRTMETKENRLWLYDALFNDRQLKRSEYMPLIEALFT